MTEKQTEQVTSTGRARRALIWTVIAWPVAVGLMVLADQGADWNNPVVRVVAILALPGIFLLLLCIDPLLRKRAPEPPDNGLPPADPPR